MSTDNFAAAAADFIKLLSNQRPELALATARLLESVAGIIRESIATHDSQPLDAPGAAQTLVPLSSPALADVAMPTPAAPATSAPAIVGPPSVVGPTPVVASILAPTPGPKTLPVTTAFVPLKLGDTSLQIAVAGTTAEIGQARQAAQTPAHPEPAPAPRYDDIALVETRCEIKAQSCLALIPRRAAAGTPDEDQYVPPVRALLAKAKALPECFLWVFFPDRAQPDDATLHRIAANYQNLAKAARLAARSEELGQRPLRLGAVELLAEAQSALRVSLRDTWLYNSDRDQDAAFTYLNQATKREEIFIERYMRLDDPADPLDHQNLASRLDDLAHRFENEAAHEKDVRKFLSKLKHHARIIANNPDESREEDWLKIESAAASLVQSHLQISDPRLLDTLGPIRDQLPELASLPNVRQVLSRDAARETPDAAPREYSADVVRVRNHLRGGAVVLVGGERRPEAENRIREAFELRDVVWVSLGEHASSAPAQAPILRPEVRLVFILIKLAGHQHVEDVARFAREAGKPLVRVPAGYNPEQLAAQALTQVAHQLHPAHG